MVDWPSYNESLVRRGQVLLDFDVLDGWDHELSKMNLGKVGEPYCYPDSFIHLLGYMRAYFHLPYRQTQGVVIAHANKGRGCVWNEEIQDCIHQNHVFRVRLLSDNILPEYVTIFSKSKLARNYFFKSANQTVNLASLNMTALGNLPVAIPPKCEQEEILHIINEYLILIDRVEQFCRKAKDNLHRLTQSILTKAFRGELVPHDPHDEPASLLLERIESGRKKKS